MGQQGRQRVHLAEREAGSDRTALPGDRERHRSGQIRSGHRRQPGRPESPLRRQRTAQVRSGQDTSIGVSRDQTIQYSGNTSRVLSWHVRSGYVSTQTSRVKHDDRRKTQGRSHQIRSCYGVACRSCAVRVTGTCSCLCTHQGALILSLYLLAAVHQRVKLLFWIDAQYRELPFKPQATKACINYFSSTLHRHPSNHNLSHLSKASFWKIFKPTK